MTPKHLHNKLTREDVDDKLERFEARFKKRLTGINSKVDLIFDRVNHMVEHTHDSRVAANEAKNAVSNIGRNILFAAFVTVGIMFMVWFILMITS